MQLNPPLREDAIAAFEACHGVSLPAEYRRFLSEVGNGGGGIVGLGQPPPNPTPRWADFWRELPRVREPFPFTEAWDRYGRDAQELRPRTEDGCLMLASGGCDLYWLLVVTGPERGHVWALIDPGVLPFEPRTGFLDWAVAFLAGRDDMLG